MLLTPEIVPVIALPPAPRRASRPRVTPRFRVGDRCASATTTHHSTRLPGYLRGKIGMIEAGLRRVRVPRYPCHGLGEKPQHCYSVRFTARELWGPTASDRDTLRVDVFDDYMDPD